MKVLKFQADWCQPCKMLTNTIKDDIVTDIPIELIDLDNNSNNEEITNLLKKYDVRSVPTLILLDDNGVEIRRKVGLGTIEELQAFFKVN